MNFLAHLHLAGADEGLRIGAMLGDFVRGNSLGRFPPAVKSGIRLHRRIDAYSDRQPDIATLRTALPAPFRRYGGIIIDLFFDYELARRWGTYSRQTLEAFDDEVRVTLARHADLLPEDLVRFMAYADRRGLFAAYRQKAEILHSLRGIGRRLSRPNPLHRAGEIWDDFEPRVSASFESVYAALQSEVAGWLKSKSTTTGS
jgi:acyl carrier protein phosphodiesterase